MNSYSNFEAKMELGKTGNPISIPLPFDRLSSHISITRNQYSLVGGNPGTGKSSFAHQIFALELYDWMKAHEGKTDIKLRVFIYSLERAEEFYIAKWVCYRIFEKYGILVHPRLVLGMVPKQSMPDQMYDLIKQEKEHFDEMSDTITMVSNVTTVAKIDRDLTVWANANGTRSMVPDPISGEMVEKYVPNDLGLITVVIIDHIGRVKRMTAGAKVTVDAMSEVLCKHRDKHGFSPVVVCQFNRNIGDVNRRKLVNFLPEEGDFKESGNMFEDSDAVYALFNPRKFGVEQMFEYPLLNFQSATGENRFRVVTILKNSLGADLINVPLNFIGETGQFKELPHHGDMNDEKYWWAANPARQTMTGKVIKYDPSLSQATIRFTL